MADKKKQNQPAPESGTGAGATPTAASAAAANKKEPFVDRVMKDVIAPPAFPLTRDQLFDKKV